jgi:ZIP family zinc transporter
MTQIILYSAAAGICGMGLGGLIPAILLKRPSERVICWLLSFAAGVMTSIVCFGLIPEAFELAGLAVSAGGLVLGILAIMMLNHFIKVSAKLIRSGVLMLFAIGLHNIPEGIAIGAGGSHNPQLGALLALMIALHNIPEGMAIAAPFLAGGMNRWKAVSLTALCGLTTLLGGLLGIFVGGISDLAVALSLSAAGGAMLYIVFGEIIPMSLEMTKNRAASIVTLFGIVVGLVVTQI